MTVKGDLLTALATGKSAKHCIEALSNANLQTFIADMSAGELALGANQSRDLLRVAAESYLAVIHHNTRDSRDR